MRILYCEWRKAKIPCQLHSRLLVPCHGIPRRKWIPFCSCVLISFWNWDSATWLCKSHSVPRAPGYPCLENKGSQYPGKARIRGWDPHRRLVPRPLPALDSSLLLREVLKDLKKVFPGEGSVCLTQRGAKTGHTPRMSFSFVVILTSWGSFFFQVIES